MSFQVHTVTADCLLKVLSNTSPTKLSSKLLDWHDQTAVRGASNEVKSRTANYKS